MRSPLSTPILSCILSRMVSYRDVIRLWGSADKLAEDIGAPRFTVRKWLTRDSIPSQWWSALMATRTARKGGLTIDTLVELAGRKQYPHWLRPTHAKQKAR